MKAIIIFACVALEWWVLSSYGWSWGMHAVLTITNILIILFLFNDEDKPQITQDDFE